MQRMKHLRSLTFLFLLFVVTPAFAAPGEGFSLFYNVEGENQTIKARRFVSTGTVESLDQLADIMKEHEGAAADGPSLVPGRDEVVEVEVMVPKGAPADYVEAYTARIKQVLAPRMGPKWKLVVKTSFIDTKFDRQVFDDATRILRDAAAQHAPGDVLREEALNAAAQIDEEKTKFDEWRDSWLGRKITWLNNINPLVRTPILYGVGVTKGLISFSVTFGKFGHNPISFLIAAANGVATAMFGGFKVSEWQDFCSKHKFLFSKRFPVLEKFWPIRAYNDSVTFKTVTMEAIRSLGIAFVIRMAAHLGGMSYQSGAKSGQEVANPWSWSFLTEGGIVTAGETIGDALFGLSARRASQRNVVNYMGRSYIVWAISFIDTFMHAMFRSGDTQKAYILLTISTAVKAGVYLGTLFLPSAPKRMVIISDAIPQKLADGKNNPDWPHIKRALNLGEAWNIRPSEAQQAELANPQTSAHRVEEILNTSNVPSRSWKHILSALRESGGNALKACRNILAGNKETATD